MSETDFGHSNDRRETVLDKALNLAASGRCQSIQQIGAVLRREGFPPGEVKSELSSSAIRGRLKKLIARTRPDIQSVAKNL